MSNRLRPVVTVAVAASSGLATNTKNDATAMAVQMPKLIAIKPRITPMTARPSQLAEAL